MAEYSEEVIRQAFDTYDADGSGFIEADEMKKAFEKLGFDQEQSDRVCACILEQHDTDKDNKISFEEFKTGLAVEGVTG